MEDVTGGMISLENAERMAGPNVAVCHVQCRSLNTIMPGAPLNPICVHAWALNDLGDDCIGP
jgi:hypothetical protein